MRFGYELEDIRAFLLDIAKLPMNSPIREQLVSFVHVLSYEVYKLETALAATGVASISPLAHNAEVDGDFGSTDRSHIQSEASDPVEMTERVKKMFGVKE